MSIVLDVAKPELEEMIERAVRKVLSEADDEMLNITQLCERIKGLSFYTFNKLKTDKRLKQVSGKYSLKAVKAAMQSQSSRE